MQKDLLQPLFLLTRVNFKRTLILLFFVIPALTMHAQVAGDFRSKATVDGKWSDTLSWEIYNGTSWVDSSLTPGDSANVNVLIQDGTVIHIKKTPVKAVNKLTVGQGSSGILDFDSINCNLTVSGATVINSGGQINFTTTGSGRV